jgi:TonB-dependent starch-binding outer membrane protein SusC
MKRLSSSVPLVLAVMLLPGTARSQERSSVTGQVIAQTTNEALHGVRVAIPALNMSTVTDERGRFQLAGVPLGSHTLRLRLIGYRQVARDVSVGADGANVTIEMVADPLRLDELVVVGYGAQRRGDVGGAISSLKPAEIVPEASNTSLNQRLQGHAAGVYVNQNAGNPGAAISVRIRGSSSISGGNEPLYVIDGVPLTQGNYSALNIGFGGQGIDALSDVNMSDIESIDILKDASAAAIYGSRASNGVVLITTKRGRADRTEFTFGGYYGTQKDWRRLDLLNAQQYMEIYNEGSTARFGPPSASGVDEWYCYADQGTCDVEAVPGTDTDWLAEVMRRAPMKSLDGSVRGGTDRVRYYVSGSSVRQDGIIQTMGYRRMNGRVNLDYVPFPRLAVGTSVQLVHSVTNRHSSDNTIYSAWANAIANPPIEPVFDALTGNYYETLYANPVGMNRETESEERGLRILGNSFATYSLFEGIAARVSVGLDQLTMRSRRYDSPNFGPWVPNGGRAQAGNNFATKVTYEGTISFNRTVRPGHDVSGLVGGSYEDNFEDWSYVQGEQFPSEYFKYITSAAKVQEGTSTRTDWGLVSYFGRLSYTFADRVTTTLNVRRDGSSRFGSANRFGTFPAASMLWRIGSERFMQRQKLFSNLALRLSYGLTGNQQLLGDFASRGLFTGGANYLDQPGIAPSQLANPELRWEKTNQLNLGVDFSVLDDRFALTVDLYDKRTDDLLVARPIPRTNGFAQVWSNVGAMQNRGIEVSVTARLLQAASARGLNWSTTFNVSQNRNKVTALYNDQPFNAGFGNRVEVGKPLAFFYGWVTDGIFQTIEEVRAHATQTVHSNPRRATSAGDIRFKDLNGDSVITADDRTMIGSPWPDYEGGITNTLSFRGFDMSAFLQFSLGNEILNANGIYMHQYGSGGDNHTTRALRRWTPQNPNTTEPRAVWSDPNLNTRISDRFVEDGSFLRLKNLVIGYTLPASLAPRLGYRTLRVYVQGQNLATLTRYSGFDPEVSANGQSSLARGADFYTLPQPRTITIGFNVGF